MHLQDPKTKLILTVFHCIITKYSCCIKTSMSPRLHKACIPSPSCKLLPPTADAVACDASKWTLPFLTSKEVLALSTAAWEGERDCTLAWEEDCWPCWPSWRLRGDPMSNVGGVGLLPALCRRRTAWRLNVLRSRRNVTVSSLACAAASRQTLGQRRTHPIYVQSNLRLLSSPWPSPN